MPGAHCAVVGCSNGCYRLQLWEKTVGSEHGRDSCPCQRTFVLYTFPSALKEPEKRKIWIKALSRLFDLIK